MADIRIKEYSSLEGVTMDLLLLNTGLLDEREEMATAVRVALGTDRLADAKEILPDPDSTDRRGWWGDLDAAEIWGGWQIGCKNWLLSRAKITEAPAMEGSTLQRARQYTIDALQPLIDKGVASQIDVDAVRTELQRIEVTATIFRGPLDEIDLRFQLLWEEDVIIDDSILPSTPSINKIIRVPYRNLSLSSTPPLFRKMPPQANLLLSSASPSISITDNGKAYPARKDLVLSTLPPLRIQGNDAFTVLLMHLNGTNGSTVFTDTAAGASPHTFTANGGAVISTAQSKFGGASLDCGAGTGWINTPDNSNWSFGSGDWTVDCWFNVSAGGGTIRSMGGNANSDASSYSFGIDLFTSNVVRGYMLDSFGNNCVIVGTTTFNTAGWHHVALTRSGNTLRLFVDGVQEGGNFAVSGSAMDSSSKLSIGRWGEITSTQWNWNGFIDEFRISVGVARWTANFVPQPYAYYP